VAGVRLLGLELVWGTEDGCLEIRYFEDGCSEYIRDTLQRIPEESVGD